VSGSILHWQLASPFGVQGWISGSRRIRDHWASSFLVSWLSACAMKALVEGNHGAVTFPALDDDPLWRRMTRADGELSEEERIWFIGTLPNRFRAVVTNPEVFRPRGDDPCSRAVRENWQKLTDAALLLPGEDLDVLLFACTAASVVLGDGTVHASLRQAKPGARTVTPPSAAMAAFTALGVRRIALLTPYTPDVTAPMAAWFAERGVELVRACCLGLDDDREMARLDAATLRAAARAAADPAAEALFVSCTAVRAAALVDRLEEESGLPVVSSNLAMAWRTRALLGLGPPADARGHLLATLAHTKGNAGAGRPAAR